MRLTTTPLARAAPRTAFRQTHGPGSFTRLSEPGYCLRLLERPARMSTHCSGRTGTVYAHSADSVSAGQFTSFAGLSFPAAATTRHKLRLENGWKPGLAAWQSGPPTYNVSDGMVHLSGALRLPAKGSAVFAVLPKSARPASKLYVSVLTADFSVGAISIDTDGRMEMQSASGTQFTSLAGIAFTTATTGRATLHLIDGWQSGQAKYHTGAPAYSVTDGVVHLSGSLTQPAGGNSELAVLPAAIRPTHDLYIQVYTVSGDLGTVRIEPDGAVLASSHTGTTASVFTSLAGICYPLKS